MSHDLVHKTMKLGMSSLARRKIEIALIINLDAYASLSWESITAFVNSLGLDRSATTLGLE